MKKAFIGAVVASVVTALFLSVTAAGAITWPWVKKPVVERTVSGYVACNNVTSFDGWDATPSLLEFRPDRNAAIRFRYPSQIASSDGPMKMTNSVGVYTLTVTIPENWDKVTVWFNITCKGSTGASRSPDKAFDLGRSGDHRDLCNYGGFFNACRPGLTNYLGSCGVALATMSSAPLEAAALIALDPPKGPLKDPVGALAAVLSVLGKGSAAAVLTCNPLRKNSPPITIPPVQDPAPTASPATVPATPAIPATPAPTAATPEPTAATPEPTPAPAPATNARPAATPATRATSPATSPADAQPTPAPATSRATSAATDAQPAPTPATTHGTPAPSQSTTVPVPVQPTFAVMNTSETPPDGVWFRNSPHTADTNRITGLGVYMNESVRLLCYATGDSVGQYANTVWYRTLNVSRATVAGRENSGFLNAHYVNDGLKTNQVDPGVPVC